MTLTHSNQYGATYEFGISDSEAPSISGFKARRIELRYEPEVFEQSQQGEGLTDSVTTSKPDKRAIHATVSGVITDVSTYRTSTATFVFRGRFFIIQNVSEPREKGKYVEGTVEAHSFPLVTS